MASRNRNNIFIGMAVGGVFAFVLFKLVSLLVLFAGDTAPRATKHWAPLVSVAGTLMSGLFGLACAFFVARSSGTASLLRRISTSAGAFGIVVTLCGFVLFFMPHRQPVHPGRMAGGDIAAGSIALYILMAGCVLALTAAIAVLFSVVWSWLRRGKDAAVTAS